MCHRYHSYAKSMDQQVILQFCFIKSRYILVAQPAGVSRTCSWRVFGVVVFIWSWKSSTVTSATTSAAAVRRLSGMIFVIQWWKRPTATSTAKRWPASEVFWVPSMVIRYTGRLGWSLSWRESAAPAPWTKTAPWWSRASSKRVVCSV